MYSFLPPVLQVLLLLPTSLEAELPVFSFAGCSISSFLSPLRLGLKSPQSHMKELDLPWNPILWTYSLMKARYSILFLTDIHLRLAAYSQLAAWDLPLPTKQGSSSFWQCYKNDHGDTSWITTGLPYKGEN